MASFRRIKLPDDDKDSWDSTLAEDKHCEVCSHATAQGNVVYGETKPNAWQTRFDHSVGRLCSNSDGSIIVASTIDGTVSLLAGSHGAALAARKVSQGLGTAAEISFVTNSDDAACNKDTLVIMVPDDSIDATKTQLFLVSNIDGPALNCTDTIADATRSMSIEAICIPIPHVELLQTTRHAGHLRFAAVTGTGQLLLFEYQNKELVTIGPPLEEAIHVSSGMVVQRQAASANIYLVFCIRTENNTCNICWYSLSQLSIVCQMGLPSSVTCLESVESCAPNACLALSAATKDAIHVVQVLVEETMGLAMLQDPHTIYNIPCSSVMSMAATGPYSFRVVSLHDKRHIICRDFSTSPLVGQIRLLLHQGRHDEAEQAVKNQKEEDDFSHFHPSEVSLSRLQSVLKGEISSQTMIQAQSCLGRLTHLDGSDLAADNLLAAADAVLNWPSPPLPIYRLALTAMSQTLAATQAAPVMAERLTKKRKQLDDANNAIQALIELIQVSTDVALDGNFSNVRSMADLLTVLLSEGLFGAALSLHRLDKGKCLSPDVVVSTIISLSPSVDPRGYMPLLETSILGLKSVKHSLLSTVGGWACRTADALVTTEGLESAIFLLQHVHDAMNRLQSQVYSSFASFSPFVETFPSRQLSPRNAGSSSASFRSNESLLTERPSIGSTASINQPVPTILELGRLKGGAIKSRVVSLRSSSADVDDDDCDDIEVKLRHAKVLYKARGFGLTCDAVSLRQFSRRGGATFLGLELVRLMSRKAKNHKERLDLLQGNVKVFCDESDVSFDEVLLSYGDEVCDSKDMSQAVLAEATSLARCCVMNSMKCTITLRVLRAALLCGAATPCLSTLSKDAIAWAGGDLYMRSELTEATRLLVINSIAVTYCGTDAALELFRIDNPSHAVKLLAHVCRHVSYSSALSDALKLCDAFTHLTKEDAFIQIIEMAILSGKLEACTGILSQVFDHDKTLAQSTWTRALDFCSVTLSDICETVRMYKFRESERAKATQTCSLALAMLEIVQKRLSSRILKNSAFEAILSSFQRVRRLQHHHDIFVSPVELDTRDKQLEIVTALVASIRIQFGDSDKDTISLFEKAKRATQLLVGASDDAISSVWFTAIEKEACKLVWSVDDALCVQFLVQSGALNSLGNDEAAQAVLSVVLNFCKRASQGADEDHGSIVSQMKLVLRASQLLHDFVLVSCPKKLLSTVSALSVITEAVGRVLVLADNGVGDELEAHRRQLRLWNCDLSSIEKEETFRVENANCNKPFLHSSWYVGDGLLLPLDETHGCCVEFCMDLVGLILCDQSPSLQGSEQLHELLDQRGAHATALRVGCLTMASTLSAKAFNPVENYQRLVSFSVSYQSTLKSLAERSLGGSGNGITNPKVDSELALSYLHLLPTKLGFKVYQSSIPGAITKCDFGRVRTLSSIGIVAGKGLPDSRSDFVPRSWKKQEKFVEQCDRLSKRASWWTTLQDFQVEFDPRRFEDSNSSHANDGSVEGHKESLYAASLLEQLIFSCCEKFQCSDLSIDLAFRFCTAFGVDLQVAAQKHVEFLLSCPSGRENWDDIRYNLSHCEKATRQSLKSILSSMKRAAIIRKSLVSLEANETYDIDYERHGLYLNLYQEALVDVIASDATQKIDIKPFQEELESIDRRRDTLSVLVSFFDGEQRDFRPRFTKFFKPLPIVFGLGKKSNEVHRIGVLGLLDPDTQNVFDPLGPLQEFLCLHADASTATALAPLCVPLDLPLGYVHARTLVARFQLATSSGSAKPSLDSDILPVLNRLRSSKDQCILSEWCASMYREGDSQKMQCLDIALEQAMKASAEIEKRARRKASSDFAKEEHQALAMVRRISHCKSTLSDKIQVNEILESSKIGDADNFRAVKKMIDDLTARLNEDLWTKSDAAPEKFVELLLTEASLIAAQACLAIEDTFALDHLRYMAAVVHKACKEISEQYSHVHTGALCRKLARSWLVHGDSTVSLNVMESNATKSRNIVEMQSYDDEDEDETVNFVMDLNQIDDSDRFWTHDVPSKNPGHRDVTRVTREEEPSALDLLGSAREVSEAHCAKVALRIAFVMSYADDYHPKAPSSPTGEIENAGDSHNTKSFNHDVSKKKRRGLLARIPVGDSNHDSSVMEHGRELLRIVFAKAVGYRERSDPSLSFISNSTNDVGIKAASFAMRYRALRTAAILCPQEALERIVREEGFLQKPNGGISCSLRQCTFGAFVAKEIEEMGLALPHSDLAQLSSMQFSSYARAIRRNSDMSALKTKGRLLLLMMEMSTVPGTSLDQTLVSSILSEMCQLHLPRSLLFACERYSDFIHSAGVELDGKALENLSSCVSMLANICLKEADPSLSLEKVSTLSRVATLLQVVSEHQPSQVCSYIEGLVSQIPSFGEETVRSKVSELVIRCASHIQDTKWKAEMFCQLHSFSASSYAFRPQLTSGGLESHSLKDCLAQLEVDSGTRY